MRKNFHVLWAPLLVACLTGLGPEALAQPSLLDPTVTQIAAGGFHTCALTTGGGVKCWGSNGAAGLGDGTYTDRPNPVDVAGLSGGVAYIAAGQLHTCALTTSGGVKCWGYNGYGQLGDGTKMNRTTAVDVAGLTSGVASIAAGSTHTCALTTAGGVKCWGYNGAGWLGDGTTDERLTPVDVQGLTSGVLRLAVGVSHSCVVTTAGGVKCWGANNFSQVGDATSTDRLTPTAAWGLTSGVAEISAGAFHTCALSSSGGATCWGHNGYGQVGDATVTYSRLVPTSVLGLTGGVAGISTGEDHTCAVTIEGGVKCWGYNGYGQLGDGTMVDKPAPTDVVGLGTGVAGVSARGYHSCALTATGEVKCWGANGHGEVGNGLTSPSQTTAVSVAGLSGVAAGVAAGETHGCAVSEGGGARCWGRNDYLQLGDGTAMTRLVPTAVTGLGVGVARVATGNYHSCALTRTGGVKCWGYNANGQLGDGTPFMRFEPVGVIGLASGVSDVVAGAVHNCALTTAGGVKCWGENSEGWLGNGTTTGGRTPVDVTGLSSGVVSISARGAHTCALTAAGGVKCWGANNAGQLGDGSTMTRSTPVDVPGLTSGVAGIAAGGEHSCALLTSGEIKCWGSNVQGQLGDGAYLLSQPTPVQVSGAVEMTRVAAGDFHTCATTAAGAPKCWGYNGSGGLGNGSTAGSAVPVDVLGLSAGVTDLALGNGHTCARTQQGGLFCWGENADGWLGDGTTVDRSTPGQVQAGQTITFTAPASLPFGVATTLTATSSSGLAVTFDTWTPGTCSIQDGAVTAIDTALCGIRASQPGDGGHAAARQALSLVIVTTGTVPGPPIIGTALAGDSAVTVAFTPPSSDGGSPITGYTATCGAASGSGGASPVLVPGLQNGVAVTCTVVATNASGDSAPSAPSNSVTPSESSNVTLTLNLDGIGSGEVAAGANVCNNGAGGPQSCSFSYTPGAVVSLVAYGSPGSGFGAWTGACAHRGNAPTCDVTMTGDVVVGASYVGPQTLTIEVVSSENGVGQTYVSTNGGINLLCDGAPGTTVTCTAQVPMGDTVYFSAFPGNLSVLDSIVGCTADPFDPNGSGCYPGFVMTGPKAVVATFRGPQTLTVDAVSLENGVGQAYANGTDGMNLACDAIAGTTARCTVQVRVGTTVSFGAFPGNLSVLESIAGCTADPFDPNGSGCYPAFVMTGPKTVTATFRGPQTLTIEAASLENGEGEAITSNGLGMVLSCPGAAGTTRSCTVPVRVGDLISFYAFSAPLSALDSIAGCVVDPSDPNGLSCNPPFTMTGPKTLTATFRGPQTLTIESVSLENGVGEAYASNSNGLVLSCSGIAGTTRTCSGPVRPGDAISFYAAPGPLSTLESVAGCVASPFDPSGAGCNPPFTMTGPKTVTATFRGFKTLFLDLQSIENGQGIISMSPQTPEGGCALTQPAQSASCARAFPLGTALTLIADAVMPGSVFEGWTGACAASGTNPTCPVVLLSDTAVGALFHGPQTLTVTFGGTGSGTVYTPPAPCPSSAGPCGVSIPIGATSLLAVPSADSDFQSWTGPCAGQGSTCLLTVADDLAVQANFILKNRRPVAVIGGPFAAGRNVPIAFSAASSSDPDGDALSYHWNFGDGYTSTAVAPDYAYQTNGTFTVSLMVSDGLLNSASVTTTATITNTPPVAAVGGPYVAYRNQAMVFNGSGSSDPNGDPLTYAWTFGAGQGSGTGVTPLKTYSVAGTFTVTLTVNDGSASSGTSQTTVLVRPTNLPPIANPGGPYTGALGQPVTFSASASVDPYGDPLTYTWDFGDGTMGTGVAPSHSYATSGVFAVAVRVSDGFYTTAYVATTAAISNSAPTADAGGSYAGARGQAIAFTGAGTDADGDALTYFWDFGDGATAPGPSVSHAYATLGSFTAILTTTDGVATSAPATATVTIGNRVPTVSLEGSYSGVRQQPVSFVATGSDADGDPITYSWDFGDGATGTGSSVAHSYATVGTFTVVVTVNDGVDNSSPASAAVTISNQAPAANAGGPYSGVRNAAVTFSGAASSDADGDMLTYEWAFGDGGTGTGVSPTHAYASTGTFTVTLMVNDGTTNSAPSTSAVAISNQAPAANAGGPYSGVRNTSVTFAGAGSSDPDGDPLTYSWDFGDGSAAGAGAAPTHAYTTTGTFTVTLTVNDGTVSSAPATATVTISNQTPVANAGGPYSGTRLAAVTFSGAGSSDPDGDALTYAWAFGDGGTGTGAAPTHLYTAVGTFTVTLTVNDGTVSSAPVTTTVQITNVAPTVSITAPAGGAVFHAPASVLVSAAAADLDGSVARVEFFAGGGKIGEALGAPYSVMWSGAAPGVYALTAAVTDSSGATATSAPVSVLLNAPPTVALTAPADNAQFAAPASITLTASASDPDGTIAQVEFFRGTTSLGVDINSPYSVTWSGAASDVYTLTAVATDNRGAVLASAPVTVKVTATLTPTADAYVRASNGNSNFGTATTVTVQQGSSNSNRRWTYLKFDLSSVPTITSAKVRVFGAVSATTSTTIQTAVYSVSNTTWTETGLTWNNKPATGTTALATVAIVNNSTTARWYELDVTAYVQAEKAAGRNVVTLAFKNLANSSPYVSFTSKEGAAASRPQVLLVP